MRGGRGVKERSDSGSLTKSLDELWGGKKKWGDGRRQKGKRRGGVFKRSEVTRRTLGKK